MPVLSCAIPLTEQQQKEYEDKLAAEGIEIIPFTEEQIAVYAKAVKENVWPAVRSDIGEEFFDGIVEKYNLMP